MSDLRALYQEVILDHSRNPRNAGPLPDANHEALGNNPLCGDEITLHVKTKDGVITAITFEGSGCAISTAAASLMTEAVQGKTVAEVEELFETYHDMVAGDPSEKAEVPASLGKLSVMAGVREFPVRVKCATLAWHTLQAALGEGEKTVSTE